MLRAGIADISGIVNITDIADIAMDIAVETGRRADNQALYKVVPPPGSGCYYRVNYNRVCCCLPGC